MKKLTKKQQELQAECRARSRRHLRSVRARPHWDESMEAFREEYALATAMEAARSRSGLTQAQIAARMGIPQSNVSRIENKVSVSFRTFVAYLKACGFSFRVQIMPNVAPAEA